MLLGQRLVTLCCPPDVLELFVWPLAMESEYEGKLCDGHSRKWAGINWQPNCFPISRKPFFGKQTSVDCKVLSKSILKATFCPCMALWCIALILNNYFLQAPRCALTLGQNICEKFPFFSQITNMTSYYLHFQYLFWRKYVLLLHSKGENTH